MFVEDNTGINDDFIPAAINFMFDQVYTLLV